VQPRKSEEPNYLLELKRSLQTHCRSNNFAACRWETTRISDHLENDSKEASGSQRTASIEAVQSIANWKFYRSV
jgi:hypothetical protein